MTYAQLYDADLREDEEARVALLKQLPAPDFDAQMNAYIARPTESLQMVFRHPQVVQLSVESLDRLIRRAKRALQHTPLPETTKRPALKAELAEKRKSIQIQIDMYHAERKAVAPILNAALAEAARQDDRTRAARILFKEMFAEYGRDLLEDLQSGMSEKQAIAAFRARRKARQERS